MHITIFNSDECDNSVITIFIEELLKLLGKNHLVKVINLKDYNIKYCVGELFCWIKTPGLCIVKDDTNIINKIYIESEFVIFISPIKYGFINSKLKTMLDKLLPLLNIKFEYINGIARHQKRYKKYPKTSFLFDFMSNESKLDFEILNNLMTEASNSMFTKPVFIKNIREFSAKEAYYEIINN
ncbi:MAG: NAD(P)H-dependent oxidoreductase [Campylobacteraceae bacterium]|jgi:multimeric flavodoxin WrbA|nr:NAD(P)H-dependent oxidoreductase [Campylobacteraceae bacterium]